MSRKKKAAKGLSIYEPQPEEPLRDEKLRLYKLKDGELARLPSVSGYRIYQDRIHIKKSRKTIHSIPLAAAGSGFDGKKDRIMAIPVGASGADEPPVYSFSQYVREMADPHDAVSRRRFRECALLDPTVSAGLEDRVQEFYADGYTFGLELKSSRDDNGNVLDDLQQKELLKKHESTYLKFVKQIEDWDRSKNIRGEHKQRASLETRIVEGRSMTRILPPLHELEDGRLPDYLKIVSAEDMGAVIIDRRLGVILAVRVHSTDDETHILLPTAVIYTRQRDNALTKAEQFFGRSSMEPLVQPSRTHREALNYHIPKAMASTYIPKTLLEIEVNGSDEEKEQAINSTLQNFAKEGTDFVGIEASENSRIQVVSVQPNHEMMEKGLERYDELLISGVKTTLSRLGRVRNLNRDIVTVMEISHIRNVRTTDEKQISDSFIEQLYQPLLAHLSQTKESELPVKITINRITPTDETVGDDTFERQEDLTEQKTQEINSKEIQQDDAKNTFGAKGRMPV